ncbi:MAG: hypothetical protein KDA80_20655 [Planctomycetaceae bacterium]|nr:hypothetical protein [Planctomycetaceae bacterium]
MFVLPRDPYPPPHPVAVKKAVSEPAESDNDSGSVYDLQSAPGVRPEVSDPDSPLDEIFPAPPAPEPPRPKPKQPAVDEDGKPTRRLTRAQRRREQERKERERAEAKAVAEQLARGPSLRQRVSAQTTSRIHKSWSAFVGFWTPFRATVALFLLIVSLTAVWGIRQNLLARAVRTVKEQTDPAMAAVEDNNWIEARRQFSPIVRALDRLDRQETEAQNLRLYYWEARALTRLSRESLFDLIETAHKTLDDGDADDWEDTFRSRYRRTWLVIEGALTAADRKIEDRTIRTYEMVIPWSPANSGQKVTLSAPFPILKKILEKGDTQNFIFAGELASCELAEDGSGWKVSFNEESGFLWSHFETWESLGFAEDPEVVDPEIRETLDRQARLYGIEP